ncbi:hypothetical protein SNE40_022541 [Patella caerulea]|uniref:tRNA wybutosine-synthesizing protein 5 n=1 Tax=Patella caerulea TaxID=87958 RepID=A0AAN8G487_PATCE
MSEQSNKNGISPEELKNKTNVIEVETLSGIREDIFRSEIYPQRRPVVLKGLDIGPCTRKWTVDYLSKVGGSSEVKLHVCKTTQMDFISKNFLYRSLPFDVFVKRAAEEIHQEYFLDENEKYYLRALGGDPRKDVADIKQQFPQLATDINFPNLFEEHQFFSSVLRIASKSTQLWTHYDIMDNMLIQVSGEKRVVLFNPTDADYLYLNGDKSEVLDIDNPDIDRYGEFNKAVRYECILQPGDVLFIPALWFHNVISLDFGIAVNVFWKHLDDVMYDKKDPYGNKDPLPAQRATQILDRALKTLDELPEEYRNFFARRLISRIEKKTFLKPPDS